MAAFLKGHNKETETQHSHKKSSKTPPIQVLRQSVKIKPDQTKFFCILGKAVAAMPNGANLVMTSVEN